MEKLFRTYRSRIFRIVVGFAISFIVAFWGEINQVLILFSCISLITILTFLSWGQWFEVFLLSSIIIVIAVSAALVSALVFNVPFIWNEQTLAAILNLAYTLISSIIAFYVSLRLVTRFVLPVQTRAERKAVLGRLWLYMRGKHGKAIFVKDGQQIISEKEKQHKGPGIALVNSASAIALEKEMPPEPEIVESHYGRRSTLLQIIYEAEKKAWKTNSVIIASLLRNLRWLKVTPPHVLRRFLLKIHVAHPRKFKRPKAAARMLGPGIVLVADDEIVRATLDLRKQTRSRPKINGVTRDGIEVETMINVTFVLDDGETTDKKKGATAKKNNETTRQDIERNKEAYSFHAPSGFKAVYGTPVAKADAADEEQVKEWTDLPAFVASDIFRDMISTQNFDNLFRPNSDDELPLTDFRKEFGNRVTDEAVLKERGIKILNAGFTKLSPNKKVATQRFETWQAPWRKKTTETLAAGDLQATRIIQRERAGAQYKMMSQLAEIIRDKRITKTAVVLRLFKSLESASADPSVRRMLAGDTVEILSKWTGNLRSWVGVGDDGTGEKT